MTTSGYTLLDVPNPTQKLIHIHPGAEELGRVFYPTLAINASMEEFTAALTEVFPVDSERWRGNIARHRESYLEYNIPTPVPGTLNFGEIVAHLSNVLPEDAIITNGAGNYTVWVHRFFSTNATARKLLPAMVRWDTRCQQLSA